MSTTDNNDWFGELVEILRRLRAPDGCPWDREQTHASLKSHMVEEMAELFDAIDDADDAGMVDELGDLLMHIVFHGRIAADEQRFDIHAVARNACEKMRRRHPHVFGDASAADANAVVDQWEAIKKQEKNAPRRLSALDGVPRHLPALHRAQKLQKKAAKVGFDWPDVAGVVAKIEEELAEVKAALAAGRNDELGEELGDLLFAVVNLARFRHLDAEGLLHACNRKFERRFRRVEELAAAAGLRPENCGLEKLDGFWDQAKAEAKAAGG